jgi:signal transduction histidine kinase/PAS domain-containing protein
VAASELRFRQLVANLPNASVLSFDRDLRLQVAAGELLERGGYATGDLPGRLLTEVFPASVLADVEGPYRAALEGQHADFDYSSPVDGRQFRVRVRPVLDAGGVIVGGLAINEDVSAERARRVQLEHLHRLSNVGGGWFDADSGWAFDDELLHLLGVDSAEEVLTAVDLLVLPEDRTNTRGTYRGVLAAGGRRTVQYRLRHGRTGQLRYGIGTCEAVVDPAGRLLRAVLTHADITDAVTTREAAEAGRVAAARSRTVLMRRVSDALLITGTRPLTEMLQRITDIAAAAAGDGAVLRVLTPDGLTVEQDLIAHADPAAKTRIAEFLRGHAQRFDPATGLHGEVLAIGQLLTSIGNPGWGPDLQERIGADEIRTAVEHVVFAPVRHESSVLGYLHVFRSDAAAPYEPGDDDVVQVLADRVGAAIAEHRFRQLVEHQRAAGRAIEDRLAELTIEQRELLDQLTDVEQRERMLLAEAIHDDPIQRIVAAMLRMDTLRSTLPAQQNEELDELAGMLEAAVDRLRTLIVALTPPDLTDGLGAALRDVAEGIFVGTTATISLVGVSHVGLGASTEAVAYRILREALVNARKHAHAQHITLSLQETDHHVIVTLIDDGAGATTLDAGSGHLGLATMRGRATNEGGHLEITSKPGVGTTVTLTLPRHHPPASGQPGTLG